LCLRAVHRVADYPKKGLVGPQAADKAHQFECGSSISDSGQAGLTISSWKRPKKRAVAVKPPLCRYQTVQLETSFRGTNIFDSV